jgi:hypothetical protein
MNHTEFANLSRPLPQLLYVSQISPPRLNTKGDARCLLCHVSCLLVAWLLQLGGTVEQQLERKMAFVRELKCLPVAVQTATANEQHYEVRAATITVKNHYACLAPTQSNSHTRGRCTKV